MLSQYIVRLADLVEAEARVAKEGSFRLVMAGATFAAAMLIAVAATLLLAAALFLALLATGLHPALVCLILGVLLVLAAGGFAMAARTMGNSRP